jgi:hypothetical protein
MAYVLAAGILAAVVLGFGLLRALFTSRPPASGEYVTQAVLTRIKTEYRDLT